MARIDRVDERAGLPARREPYWQRITRGRFIGFRKMVRGASGTWLARFYDGERYHFRPLGDFADLPERERYDAAKRTADEWFAHVDLGGSTKAHSVKEACEAYLQKLQTERGERAKKDTEGYFRRLVYKDAIARVNLAKLSKAHMAGWRARVLEHRSDRSSFNRNITPLRAALNLAREEGKIASDQAWLAALRPFGGRELGDRRRKGVLEREQRRLLVEKASDEARPFFRALALLPMRPGEVASLRVEHFNVRDGVLEIPTGKTEPRIVPLSREALAHFKECARGKLPSAWLIARADGSQWKKEAWRDEVKAAAKKAKLPRATVAYTLRHSLITELVTRGFDMFTVAKISGTSVRMIEKHYGHLQQEHARKALETLAFAS
jgi:integrase